MSLAQQLEQKGLQKRLEQGLKRGLVKDKHAEALAIAKANYSNSLGI